jgi:hypothetical protein
MTPLAKHKTHLAKRAEGHARLAMATSQVARHSLQLHQTHNTSLTVVVAGSVAADFRLAAEKQNSGSHSPRARHVGL